MPDIAWQVFVELGALPEIGPERLEDLKAAIVQNAHVRGVFPTLVDRGLGRSVGATVIVGQADPGSAVNLALGA